MARRLRWLLPLLALALAAPALWRATPLARSSTAEEAARRALAEGNRRVRDGDLQGAVDAYAAGWSEAAAAGRAGGPAGVLAYNLGTTLHRVGRRPEALLWYRRALRLRPADRWLADNLALVRRELAAPRPPPPGPAARVAARARWLAGAAVAAAWAALALLAFARRLGRAGGGRRRAARAAEGASLALGVVALLLWAAPAAAGLVAPRPAVLLADCGDDPPLPAGSEVWLRRGDDGGWAVAGEPGLVCAGPEVALVDGPHRNPGAFLLP